MMHHLSKSPVQVNIRSERLGRCTQSTTTCNRYCWPGPSEHPPWLFTEVASLKGRSRQARTTTQTLPTSLHSHVTVWIGGTLYSSAMYYQQIKCCEFGSHKLHSMCFFRPCALENMNGQDDVLLDAVLESPW